MLPNLVAELQALDKITARTTELRLPIGTEVAFGTLRITARACLKTPPTEPPESAAFLEIKVADPGTATKTAFTGWMFASSPSLSALEHPVYDVWVRSPTRSAGARAALPPPAVPPRRASEGLGQRAPERPRDRLAALWGTRQQVRD